jgi:hypothetical protein
MDTSPSTDAGFDVAVFSKIYDASAVKMARALATCGTRVLLDLSDNRFYSHVENERVAQRRANLISMVRSVHGITSSTETLARYIREYVPDAPPIVVIEDPVEDLQALAKEAALSEWIGLPSWLRWQSQIRSRRERGEIGFVWFGNHGVDYSISGGMGDLLKLRRTLESLAKLRQVFLSVISNSRRKFAALTADWSIPSYYLDWRALTFGRALRMHDIALIPVEKNPFTICKSANRLALALHEGLAVAADAIPSYEPFAGVTVLDDWGAGLRRYVEDGNFRVRQVEEGRRLVGDLFSPERIGSQWEAVLRAS